MEHQIELEDGVIVTVSEAPQEPVVEDTRSEWEKQGYLSEIASVIEGLETSKEQFLLPANIRTIIETVNNAKSVEDFDRYTDNELQGLVDSMRHDVPSIENRVREMMDKIHRAQTALVDVDFI